MLTSNTEAGKAVEPNSPQISIAEEWTEPQPLAAEVTVDPYPTDALPAVIRAAVVEVQQFTKAPISLVASSALGAISLAIQAHIDVRRDDILVAPVSLFILTIADSGERKTQADKMFLQAIVDYEDQQRDAAKADSEQHRITTTLWEARRGGAVEAIKQAARKGQAVSNLELKLREIEHEKPIMKRFPKLIRNDSTPEGLAKKLQKEWPSCGVISNEAGIVFGAHGMSKESVMRNLGLLNMLWDGGRYQSDRGDENRDRDVRGARLTISLMTQEATLRAFIDQSNGLVRGSGFLARFLLAWPDSTMGTRFYTEPPHNTPALTIFNQQVRAILEEPVPISADGILSPPALPLTPDAKYLWVKFHDAIEGELKTELFDVRDVASKSADIAARLAALFHVFTEGTSASITAGAFEGASRIVAWHSTNPAASLAT